MKLTIEQINNFKKEGRKISMLTAYDFPLAKIINRTDTDIVLVGDSLGTNVLGYDSVFDVTMKDMLHHTAAVSRGAKDKFIISDLPYGTYNHIRDAQNNAARLKAAGADAVKMESEKDAIDKIAHVVSNGIDVCGHIGYTPQTPGLKTEIQGKDIIRASELIDLALQCQEAGAFMIVLELMPRSLAELISEKLTIPTIGIGAGEKCDGQVQVIPDIIGFSDKIFKHAKEFADAGKLIEDAVNSYNKSVKDCSFPSAENCSDIAEDMVAEIKIVQENS